VGASHSLALAYTCGLIGLAAALEAIPMITPLQGEAVVPASTLATDQLKKLNNKRRKKPSAL